MFHETVNNSLSGRRIPFQIFLKYKIWYIFWLKFAGNIFAKMTMESWSNFAFHKYMKNSLFLNIAKIRHYFANILPFAKLSKQSFLVCDFLVEDLKWLMVKTSLQNWFQMEAVRQSYSKSWNVVLPLLPLLLGTRMHYLYHLPQKVLCM